MDYSSTEFESAFTYCGNDLGATWAPEKTTFRLLAPTADAALVKFYASGNPDAYDFLESIPMIRSENGTWYAEKAGNLNGRYYTFAVSIGEYFAESIDPYAKSCGVNGRRGMVIDLNSTNPPGWEADRNPNPLTSFCDAVIYELHIRDLSADRSSHIKNKGKFSV